jgi:spore coat polysaccharide biosynthesis protein SpsF (cytidylyltransferase family)
MKKIPVLITVRSSSSRLPEKCFLPFGDSTVIEHVIKRSLHYNLDPVVCTTNNKEYDRIVDIASRNKAKVFRGSDVNKLKRWQDCCKYFNIESFHSVDADDPFFCGDEVKRSFALLENGYDMVAPSPSSSNGGATVGYSLTYDILKKACINLDQNTDTEMVWSYIERVENLKKIVLTDPSLYVVKNRMTLDYQEDYILLEAIRLMIGNFATRKQVFNLIKNNKDLLKINSFRSDEWKQKQESKLYKY